jgi:hypothetical protein
MTTNDLRDGRLRVMKVGVENTPKESSSISRTSYLIAAQRVSETLAQIQQLQKEGIFSPKSIDELRSSLRNPAFRDRALSIVQEFVRGDPNVSRLEREIGQGVRERVITSNIAFEMLYSIQLRTKVRAV